MDAIGLPQVGACLDVGHAHYHGGSPLHRWVEVLGPRLRHLHLHDERRQLRSAPGDGGAGTIDWPPPCSPRCAKRACGRPPPSRWRPSPTSPPPSRTCRSCDDGHGRALGAGVSVFTGSGPRRPRRRSTQETRSSRRYRRDGVGGAPRAPRRRLRPSPRVLCVLGVSALNSASAVRRPRECAVHRDGQERRRRPSFWMANATLVGCYRGPRPSQSHRLRALPPHPTGLLPAPPELYPTYERRDPGICRHPSSTAGVTQRAIAIAFLLTPLNVHFLVRGGRMWGGVTGDMSLLSTTVGGLFLGRAGQPRVAAHRPRGSSPRASCSPSTSC